MTISPPSLPEPVLVSRRAPVRIVAAPPHHAAWSELLESSENARLAHSPAWRRAIAEAYGHRAIYLRAESASDGVVGLLPAFLLRRRPFSVLASMPFLDSGGPIGASRDVSRALVQALLRLGARLGVRSVELRSAAPLDVPTAPRLEKVNLVRPLPDDPERLWREVGSKIRNQVRKARTAGVTVRSGGAELIDRFYAPWSARMRELGSPPHARRFFRAIFQAFAAGARVFLATKDGVDVGSLVALPFRDRLVVPWAASLPQWRALCPNMLLYWETLRAASAEGFRTFDFGRSTADSGTWQFKRQWGAREESLFWYRVRLPDRGDSPRAAAQWSRKLFPALWSHLPLPITRWVGPTIRGQLPE